MIARITSTTDGKFLGVEIETDNDIVVFDPGFQMAVERRMPLPNGVRLISSNYIVDAEGV